MDHVHKIRHRNKDYAVVNMKYKGMDLPVVMDWKDYRPVRNLDKRWKCHKNGFLSCHHRHEDQLKDVFLHELVMVMKNANDEEDSNNKPILHVNRIGLDNRRVNLEYRGMEGGHRNTKKKKRTVKLPEDCGIVPKDIPTYIWYLKPNGTHGDRFMVDVGDIKWKTTASKSISLTQKLSDAKRYLRNLKREAPDLFDYRSMNGDYTQQGQKLAVEYRDIIRKAGYHNIQVDTDHKRTRELLSAEDTESSGSA